MLVDVVAAIKEEMYERKWSIEELAARMTEDNASSVGAYLQECEFKHLAIELLFSRDDGKIGDKMANDLARAFGVSAEFFLNLEKAPSPVPVENNS